MPPKRTTSEAHTLLLTAAMESAAVAADWEGFAALVRERELTVEQMIASGNIDFEVVRELNEAEVRIELAMEDHRSLLSAPTRKARLAVKSALSYRICTGHLLLDQAS